MGLTYGEGYGLHRRSPGRSGYRIRDADAAAYVAAMAVEPSVFTKREIDKLVIGLKADGLWTLLKLLGLHCLHDHQAARIDLRNPARVASVAGWGGSGPPWTIFRGFGDASNQDAGKRGYLNWGVNWNAVGIGQNDHCVMTWNADELNNMGFQLGGGSNATGSVTVEGRSGNNLIGRSAAALSNAVANANGNGLIGLRRNGGTSFTLVKDGAQLGGSVSRASEALVAAPVLTGAFNTNPESTSQARNRIDITWVSGYLDDTKLAAAHARLNAFREAMLGISVPL